MFFSYYPFNIKCSTIGPNASAGKNTNAPITKTTIARKNIKKAGLENKAFMHLKNLWQVNTQDFDVVILYLFISFYL